MTNKNGTILKPSANDVQHLDVENICMCFLSLKFPPNVWGYENAGPYYLHRIRLKGLHFESYSKAIVLFLIGKYINATFQITEKTFTIVKKRMKCMCSLEQCMQCNR